MAAAHRGEELTLEDRIQVTVAFAFEERREIEGACAHDVSNQPSLPTVESTRGGTDCWVGNIAKRNPI
jgi:hypothetical protein